ncbi:uncharacterized protein N7479_009898 [Penicillium vulpinum]|uniref:uncharacterized protein n=1 Tax=Penicillium vulpinum TaxID=29845 RepID=UPI0025472B0E|nr:uncharacterized protein N7479_009898 [Penicillium vulpinum]KAJ5951485.1 hypothetical protein N7479_009898 [Penicillium vulpinum]
MTMTVGTGEIVWLCGCETARIDVEMQIVDRSRRFKRLQVLAVAVDADYFVVCGYRPACGGAFEHKVGIAKSEVGGGKGEMGNGKMLGIRVIRIRSFATAGEKISAGSLCEATPGCWFAPRQLMVSSI